jgi:hypothetical protein
VPRVYPGVSTIKNYFGDCDKLYQFQNAVGDIQYLISSNENDDGLYHFMEFKGCVSEDSPKEIFEIYEDLSKRRTNSLNKLNEFYKDLNNELLRLKKEKQKVIEEDNKGISPVSKPENIEMKNSEVTSGFIYLLSHKMMEGIYKVGATVRNPDIRAQELSLKYNLPGSFKVVFFMKVNCPYLVEQRVLEKLNQKIVADEFVKEEIDIIEELIVSESERIISNIFEKD